MRLRNLAIFGLTIALLMTASPAGAVPRMHLAENCNTLSNPFGRDQRICISVNRHDLFLKRQGLLTFCDGPTGARAIFLDYLILERQGRVVERTRKHQWVRMCGSGKHDYSTPWDVNCPRRPAWQAHARFALRWASGGESGFYTIHSGRDTGVC